MIDDNSNIAEITPEENVLIPEIELHVEIPEETIIEPILETVEIKPKAKGRPKESKDKIPRPKRKVVITLRVGSFSWKRVILEWQLSTGKKSSDF